MQYPPFRNKYGYFSPDGMEFIVTNPETPRPWVNIISNGDYGFIISQAGGGFSWRRHVNLNRLTRWYQDLIRDDWGKWLYLRDLESDELYSLAYQPVQKPYHSYQVHHGLGYTVFEQTFLNGLTTQWTLFVDIEQPVEVWYCVVRNDANKPKHIELTSYLEWNLGVGPEINREFHKLFIHTRYESGLNAILAEKKLWEVESDRGHWNTEWPYTAFHAVNTMVTGWDTSKDRLIGRHGSFMNPKGISNGRFSQSSGPFEDAAAALSTTLHIEPGEEKAVIFLLGQVEAEKQHDIESLINQYADPAKAQAALHRVQKYWRALTGRASVQTPDESFNLLTNIWLKYQAISGHLWSRTGYYQQSGAYGFRDQLQTSQIWLPLNPDGMRDQIILNARHQFSNGKVLHWWHPLTDQGLETDFTDDLLWLPFMTVKYLNETTDFEVLNRTVPYYDTSEGTLLEHCLKTIEVAAGRFSERGLPLIGAGDWCDGFSAVGLGWKGESIWLGMFIYKILRDWAALLKRLDSVKHDDTIRIYSNRAENLKQAINTFGWNGAWYIAATKDDGAAIGDHSQDAAQIYLMSQTWAIISGVAEDERKQQLLRAMLDYLESDTGLMLLNPAFKTPDKFIGYITRYAPGLRENGGVYTHAATWGVLALAMEGKASDALRIFNKLNPVLQAQKNAERYSAEPYVMPGNSDGRDSAFTGRAGWSWYTGSAGWLYTIASEHIAGVRPEYDGLRIDPCIPAEWRELHVTRRFRDAIYNIHIMNPNNLSGGVYHHTINGQRMKGNRITCRKKGAHNVKIVLGE